jgi:hypothetical protein
MIPLSITIPRVMPQLGTLGAEMTIVEASFTVVIFLV